MADPTVTVAPGRHPLFTWASDRAVLVALAPSRRGDALRLWLQLAAGAIPGVLDLQPGARNVMVTVDPRQRAHREVELALAAHLASAAPVTTVARRRPVEIPVCYDPEVAHDLEVVAHAARLSVREVVRRHAAARYRVAFLGFAPGFAYLDGLPSALATARRASPRPRVPAGSVAIGGAHTGIYPLATPGGWQLIGRTPVALFDVGAEPPARLAPGDPVRLVPISLSDLAALERARAPAGSASPPRAPVRPVVEVLHPGVLATVQDLGRPGYAHLGVSACGAADPLSLRLANRLLGNPEGAAGLELNLVGGAYRFLVPCRFVLGGADCAPRLVDRRGGSREIARWRVIEAQAGERVVLGPCRQGARAYLCLPGGIEVPAVLGSRSTHLASGLGGFDGRALRAGDRLAAGPPREELAVGGQPALPAAALAGLEGRLFPPALRVVAGPQLAILHPRAAIALAREAFRVGEHSDRFGLRLRGPELELVGWQELATEGAPLGALQLTRSGEAILLGPDHQTTGGYPKVAAVIAADLPAAGQLGQGAAVRFVPLTLDRARGLLLEQEAWLDAVAARRLEER